MSPTEASPWLRAIGAEVKTAMLDYDSPTPAKLG